MRLKHTALLIICSIMAPLPGACYDLPDRINAAPLVYYEKTDKDYDLSLAGPFLEFSASDRKSVV